MMPTTQPNSPETPASGSCVEHSQPVKWQCGRCGRPLCSACKPVAFDYKVFHRDCVDRYRNEPAKSKPAASSAVDAPSTGVKVVAWLFIVSAVVWLGLGLLAGGVVLISRHNIPIAAAMGNPLVVLDEIPGGRGIVGWLSILGLLAAVVQVWIGLGLLNCVPAARRAILAFAWLEITVAVMGWLVVLISQQGFWDIPVFAVVLIIFFSRKDVKLQFQPGK